MKTNLNIDTQGLREKILDLAMRGKLVEQDTGDEPASALLEKIKAEKAELVKEGKIKKSKKLPEITDDEKPFDIPDNWEWVRLGDVLIPEISKAPTEDFVYLDIASIDNKTNKIIAPKTINVLKEKVPSRARMVVEPRDILFSLVRPYLRNIAIVPESDSNLVASTGFYVIKPYKKVDFEYIFYTVLSNYVVSGLTKKYMKGDNSPSIKKGDLKNYVIPLPPLAEQRRIADKVSELFSQIDVIEKNVAEYQDLEQAMRSKLLDLAMRGKLVEQDSNDEPASELLKQIQSEKAQLVKKGKIKKGKKLPEIIDDEKPFDIPDGWEWVRLGDVLIPEISKAPTEDFVYLDIASIDNKTNKIIAPKTINVLKEKVPSRARMVVEPRDILFSLVRPYLRNIAIVPESDSNLVASTGFYVIKPYKKVDFEYIFYTVLSNYVVSGLTKKYMKGDNSPSIKKGDLENYVIPLPPLAEQRRIADKVSKLFEQLDIINNNLVSAS